VSTRTSPSTLSRRQPRSASKRSDATEAGCPGDDVGASHTAPSCWTHRSAPARCSTRPAPRAVTHCRPIQYSRQSTECSGVAGVGWGQDAAQRPVSTRLKCQRPRRPGRRRPAGSHRRPSPAAISGGADEDHRAGVTPRSRWCCRLDYSDTSAPFCATSTARPSSPTTLTSALAAVVVASAEPSDRCRCE
jgi:hypothetical protein